jgi:hypothetical protein
MILRIGRILAAVLLMLILLADVRPAVCQAAGIFTPINKVTHSVTNTTKKVAKTSVSTVKTVVTAPINLASKVGKTLTGKK